ncbi:hypothetical protein AGMMS49574_13860 [Bacteroidia bacterium]|nr:hypothetical protein AGMMS49574_13860 [Bacteroidia bacterium]
MNLNIFNTGNLYDAAKGLFKQLNINLNSNTTTALDAKSILGEFFKDKEPFSNIKELYFAGLIDNGIFQNSLFEGSMNRFIIITMLFCKTCFLERSIKKWAKTENLLI